MDWCRLANSEGIWDNGSLGKVLFLLMIFGARGFWDSLQKSSTSPSSLQGHYISRTNWWVLRQGTHVVQEYWPLNTFEIFCRIESWSHWAFSSVSIALQVVGICELKTWTCTVLGLASGNSQRFQACGTTIWDRRVQFLDSCSGCILTLSTFELKSRFFKGELTKRNRCSLLQMAAKDTLVLGMWLFAAWLQILTWTLSLSLFLSLSLSLSYTLFGTFLVSYAFRKVLQWFYWIGKVLKRGMAFEGQEIRSNARNQCCSDCI